MKLSTWFFWLALVLACLAPVFHARTANFHFKAGAGTGGSAAPEVIDMRWARPYLDANATGTEQAVPEE